MFVEWNGTELKMFLFYDFDCECHFLVFFVEISNSCKKSSNAISSIELIFIHLKLCEFRLQMVLYFIPYFLLLCFERENECFHSVKQLPHSKTMYRQTRRRNSP